MQKKARHKAGLFCRRDVWFLHELKQNAAVLYEERYEYQRQNGRQLDQDVQRRARRVLERIANRVTNNCSFVVLGTFAAEIAGFDVLLGIVPGAA